MSVTDAPVIFRTRTNQDCPGVSAQTLLAIREKLQSELGLSWLQLAEAAGFSLAMVVRFALGLSANEGRVCGFVRDCPAGWITLAGLRHLINGGATGIMLFLDEPSEGSEIYLKQIHTLRQLHAEEIVWASTAEDKEITTFLKSCHNVVSGLFDFEDSGDTERIQQCTKVLNENRTPVHAIEAPTGIDVETGEKLTEPLFASSTLSLGLPLAGLQAGGDYVGRHYLCDISISPQLYRQTGQLSGPLFSDQPVVQLLPPADASESEDDANSPKQE